MEQRHSGPRTVGFDPSVAERRDRAEAAWRHVVAARDSGEILVGVVTATATGGLSVTVDGVEAFLPALQTNVAAGDTLEALVKTKLPLAIVEVDPKRRRIVVSHRRAVETQKRSARKMLLAALAVGQVYEATVRRLVDFGAFVEIDGGIEGLVPMSEFAFERVERASDLLAVGDRLSVAVLRIDEGGRKIAFSRKNALPDPWRDHADIVRVGATVEGHVTGTATGRDAGLLVEIAPGVIGTVREGDADPTDYAIGEAVDVTVQYVDRRNRRIRLTTLAAGAVAAATTSGGFAPLGLELRSRGSSRDDA